MFTHHFKLIVTSALLAVGFSIPAAAQETPIDDLYQELLEADPLSSERVERRIISRWERSGSPAMDLLLRRGNEAMEEGDARAALDHFSALVDHAPEFAEGYVSRASAYYQLDMLGLALDDLRQTLVLEPRHFGAMQGLGFIMEELERLMAARDTYRAILAIHPNSGDAKDGLERVLMQLEGQPL